MTETMPEKMCFWPWDHKWSKWRQMSYPIVENGKKTEASVGFNERHCEICNKLQSEML